MTRQEKSERRTRAREWVGFRKAHLYTQVRLAQTLGISRRTVQYIEDEDFTAWGPNAETLARFRALAEMEKI